MAEEEQVGRSIVVHQTRDVEGKPLFIDNAITTTKYNFLTFIPKNLYEQFKRAANFYFLVMAILQMAAPWAPLDGKAAFFPLCLVVVISAVRELVEDLKRGMSDRKINKSDAKILRNGQWETVKWEEILVGDIVFLTKNEQVPVDLVMLSTGEADGVAYIDTCNLDGETNLKVRQAMPQTKDIVDAATAQSFNTTIGCDGPNNLLYTFNGYFELGPNTIPLENKQVLLRGCILRNTAWVIGVAVYTGLESKLMMNSSAARSKVSSLERGLNVKLISVFALILGLGLISAIIGVIKEKEIRDESKTWYMFGGYQRGGRSPGASFFILLFANIILINCMIPISLYVTLEVVRVFQALFVQWDGEMYHVETQTGADSRTSNLSEDLGNIEYIFSDKTGTLTRNIMEFMKCSIGGRKYGHGTTEVAYAAAKRRGIPCEKPDQTGKAFKDDAFMKLLEGDTPVEIKHFLWMLSVCHAVIPEPDPKKPYGIAFQASSPDEGALVNAAADFGYLFKARKPGAVVVNHNGIDVTVEVLAVLEFTSERKRSSVIIKHPETGQIVLYCKGADDLIMARLSKDSLYVDVTKQHLRDFAADGLRTLCAAYKVIDEEWFNAWAERFNAANCVLVDREQAIDKVANEIECDLNLLGATAIEDKLQIGVPEAIESLLKAGIKVWVITGDKRETAINIGFACSLLSSDMKLVVLDSNDPQEIITELNRGLSLEGPVALVASGTALYHALKEENQPLFFKFAERCQSVVCCRVSPLQKATVVSMVREQTGALTLAIGDGANDVGMILQADIGVGISGQEGMQAVLASDYSFAQFRFLKRLLLVHGRLNFKRNIDLINYSFYKNMVCNLCQFLYGFFCGFSSLTLYDSFLLSTFNVLFTAAPPVVYAGLERDVSLNTGMEKPELYLWEGKRKEMISYFKYWESLLIGALHALVCFFVPFLGMQPFVDANGRSLGYGGLGATIFGCVVFVTNFKIAVMSSYWTWMEHFFIWGSAAIYPIVLYIIDLMGLGKEIYGLTGPTLASASFWFSLIGSVVLAIIPIIAFNTIENSKDTLLNRVLVRERTHIFDNEKVGKEVAPAPIDATPDEDIIAPIKDIPETPAGAYPDTANPTGYAFAPPVASFETNRYEAQKTFVYGTAAEIRSRVRATTVSQFGMDGL